MKRRVKISGFHEHGQESRLHVTAVRHDVGHDVGGRDRSQRARQRNRSAEQKIEAVHVRRRRLQSGEQARDVGEIAQEFDLVQRRVRDHAEQKIAVGGGSRRASLRDGGAEYGVERGAVRIVRLNVVEKFRCQGKARREIRLDVRRPGNDLRQRSPVGIRQRARRG